MASLPARFVRSNLAGEPLPNGIVWASEYRLGDGSAVFSLEYDEAKGDVPATTYANARATYGLLLGTHLLVDVKDVGGTLYATRVAVDENAEYPSCPQCSFMDSLTVTSVDVYLDHTETFRAKEHDGHWALEWYDVSEDDLAHSSGETLLTIRCLECRGEFYCRRSDDREHAGVHYSRSRLSFVDM